MSQTKKVDPSVQLRALRWALGRDFKAMPSQEFADLIGIPAQAVRAVESRRRKLSDDDRLHIEMLLGAVWDAEREEWVTCWDQMPYTREKYEFRQSHGMRGPDPEGERAEYLRMAALYLDRLEPAKFQLGLTKLVRELRRIADQDNIPLGNIKTGKKGR